MWPLRAPAAPAGATASCTRLTPRCSGDDLRCGCQVPNRHQSLDEGFVEAAEDSDIPTGDGGRVGSGVEDDGGERSVGCCRFGSLSLDKKVQAP